MMPRVSRPIPSVSTWARAHGAPDHDETEQELIEDEEPQTARRRPNLADLVRESQERDRAKIPVHAKAAKLCAVGALACWLMSWAPFYIGTVLWVTGVALACIAFGHWQALAAARIGSRMMPPPEDFIVGSR